MSNQNALVLHLFLWAMVITRVITLSFLQTFASSHPSISGMGDKDYLITRTSSIKRLKRAVFMVI